VHGRIVSCRTLRLSKGSVAQTASFFITERFMKDHRSPAGMSRNRTQLWALAICGIAMFSLPGCGGGGDGPPGDSAPAYAQRCQLSPAQENTLELPAPTGPHCIGKTGFHLVDQARPETNTPEAEDRRELSVKIWYPAPASQSSHRASYLDPGIRSLVREGLSLPADAPDVLTNARPDAALQPGSQYPVVIFSPGFGGIVESYSALLEDLASHGMVVVAIDHPYVSGATPLANGEVALVRTPSDPEQFEAFIEDAASTLVSDQRHVLDWLQGSSIGAIGTHLDLTRIGVYGHSLGGAAALQTLRLDDRVDAAIDMDGKVVGDISLPWRKPLMFMLAENHPDHPEIDTVLRNATGPHHSVVLRGAGHLDFGDLKLLLDFYAPDRSAPIWMTLDLGPIDVSSALRATREQTLAFFRQHVTP
jgi:dienelactone hydrolase